MPHGCLHTLYFAQLSKIQGMLTRWAMHRMMRLRIADPERGQSVMPSNPTVRVDSLAPSFPFSLPPPLPPFLPTSLVPCLHPSPSLFSYLPCSMPPSLGLFFHSNSFTCSLMYWICSVHVQTNKGWSSPKSIDQNVSQKYCTSPDHRLTKSVFHKD